MGNDMRSEEQKMDAFLDALTKRLAERAPHLILTPSVMADIVSTARRDLEAPEEWSPWLRHNGRRCPLPPGTIVEVEYRDKLIGNHNKVEDLWWVHSSEKSAHITRFRYRCEPGGWVRRPAGWVPPESACPLVARRADGVEIEISKDYASTLVHGWGYVTHIRLLPRAAKTGMPEGFRIGGHGDLIAPDNELVMRGSTLRQCGPAKIRAAVEAWLDEMEKRP